MHVSRPDVQRWNHDEPATGCLIVMGGTVAALLIFGFFAWCAFSREWSARQDGAALELRESSEP